MYGNWIQLIFFNFALRKLILFEKSGGQTYRGLPQWFRTRVQTVSTSDFSLATSVKMFPRPKPIWYGRLVEPGDRPRMKAFRAPVDCHIVGWLWNWFANRLQFARLEIWWYIVSSGIGLLSVLTRIQERGSKGTDPGTQIQGGWRTQGRGSRNAKPGALIQGRGSMEMDPRGIEGESRGWSHGPN